MERLQQKVEDSAKAESVLERQIAGLHAEREQMKDMFAKRVQMLEETNGNLCEEKTSLESSARLLQEKLDMQEEEKFKSAEAQRQLEAEIRSRDDRVYAEKVRQVLRNASSRA